MEIVAVISYLLVAACVVFFSMMLSNYVDLLDKKTNLSGAFLGGILLAAVTSLPELFTSLTATVMVRDNHYVLGNILGSDIFNLVLFFIIYTFFFGKMVKSKVSKYHLLSMIFVAILYALTTIASFVFDFNHILLGWFNPISILIIAVYALSVIKTPKEEESEEGEDNSKLTVKQIIVLFIAFSILLIAASIGITYLVDWISELFHLGSTFGGALFLGVATSLPEMTATIQLCRKRNFNAAYGDIVGSCVFNFLILGLADIMSFLVKDGSGNWIGIYKIDQSAFLLLICGAVSIIATIISLILKNKNIIKNNFGYRFIYLIISVVLLGSYISFLVLSNIDLGISFAPFIA